jgi:transposase
MSHRLKVATVDSIHLLHAQGWTNRRIARELGINRETVNRYVRRIKAKAVLLLTVGLGGGASKPANAPIGISEALAVLDPANAPVGNSDAFSDSDPANATIGGQGMPIAGCSPTVKTPGRQQSDSEPWREIILAKRQQGLSYTRIHYDLVQDHGAKVSYDSVRRFVHWLECEQPLPFRRMECDPGEEAQVDFGTGATVVTPEGRRRRPHVFRFVLSHSRKGYSEASYRQTTEDFLRCMENALWYFGGVPKVLVIDNLKAGVKHPDWYDPDLNPILQSFCHHYNVVVMPTRPRTPRHKGKVERGVGYVKGHSLRCRTFTSLEEQNRHLLDWEKNVADKRIHGTTHKQPGKAFEEERPFLQPLPRERFPFFREGRRVGNRDGHVSVAKAYYSLPPEYVGQEVWVRWDSRMVRIFNHRMEPIAVHTRQEPGRFSTLSRHIPAEKISGVERGAAWLLRKIRLIGPKTTAWAEAMLQARGIPGVRVLQGLLSLSNRNDVDELEKACELAHSYQAYHLRPLRELLKRGKADAPRQTCFLEEHEIIRPLADYTAWIASALRRSPTVEESDAGNLKGFLRYDEGVRVGIKKGPPQTAGPHVSFSTRPRSKYPSSGCSSALPDSVSSDISSVVPFSTNARSFYYE